MVRRGGEKVLDDVVLLQSCASHSLATAPLRAVKVSLRSLCITVAGDRDDKVFFSEQVFNRHVPVERDDLGSSFVAELVDDLAELFTDYRALAFRAGEDVVVV